MRCIAIQTQAHCKFKSKREHFNHCAPHHKCITENELLSTALIICNGKRIDRARASAHRTAESVKAVCKRADHPPLLLACQLLKSIAMYKDARANTRWKKSAL